MIACAVYRRTDGEDRDPLRGAAWVTYPEEQSHVISARWVDQQMRATARDEWRCAPRPCPCGPPRCAPGSAWGCCRVISGDADPLLERITPPVTELGAEYWVIVHRDLRRAACVRAVIDWIRRVFDERRDELAGTAAQPMNALAAE